MKNVGIPILLPFGKFVVILWSFVFFPRFGMMYAEKSGNPEMDRRSTP
jgi:hypothetical protein